MCNKIKSLEQMSDTELEALLDSDTITPAIAKKIDDLLTKRQQPKKEQRVRVEAGEYE